MKAEFLYDDLIRMSQLECFAEEYDGFLPHSRLLFEFVPSSAIRPNLLAVATVCAFRRGIEGRLDVEGTVDRPVAEAITLFLEQTFIDFPDINFRPREPKLMPNVFALEIAGETEAPEVTNSAFQDRQLRLKIQRSSDVAGASMQLPDVSIPSNSWLLASQYKKYSLDWWGPFVAVAVLLADTFEIGTIRLPRMVDSQEVALLRGLLRTVDMRLEVAQDDLSQGPTQ